MSHLNKSVGQVGVASDEDPWASAGSSTEWEADTDVMPPEYCRQLLKISRELCEAE